MYLHITLWACNTFNCLPNCKFASDIGTSYNNFSNYLHRVKNNNRYARIILFKMQTSNFTEFNIAYKIPKV